MIKTATIIAPDIASANQFSDIIKKYKIDTKILHVNVHPRVENNSLTKNTNKVVHDLDIALAQAKNLHSDTITIACNTLSLPIFIDPAKKFLTKDQKKFVIPTIEVIEKYTNLHDEDSIILGTKPLMEILSSDNKIRTHTLKDVEDSTEKDLNLVQEIIWRIKFFQKSDTSTAPNYSTPLKNKKYLNQKIDQLFNRLNELKIKEVILGCTELPEAFDIMATRNKLTFTTINPADLVAKQILQIPL